MFELSDEEVEALSRCKNFTLIVHRGLGIKYCRFVKSSPGSSSHAKRMFSFSNTYC